MKIIDGKAVSLQVKQEIKKETDIIKAKGQKVPHLAAILVGTDGASQTYVNYKIKDCELVGFKSSQFVYDATITENELLQKIEDINQNDDIDGLIVQLPLPDHISVKKVTLAISPSKDVDGFHPQHIGNLVKGWPGYTPATPLGIVKLLEHYQIQTQGMHAVVLGRSQIVGTPMSILLSKNAQPGNCTVTLAHSRTQNLKEICLQADLLVAAIGKPNFVTAEMVKPGAVVIDVGTTRVPDPTRKNGYRLCGDVDYDNVAHKTSYITPVPGGVGPMTRTGLLLNTLYAAQQK